MEYIFPILIMLAIYFLLSLSLNLLLGYTGLIALCHAAFYGVGAYIFTLLTVKLSFPFFISLILSIIGTMAVSLIVALPSLRLKGDYFLFSSIGFQIIIYNILYNWVSLTRGPYGIHDIPRPFIFGFKTDTNEAYFIFTLLISLIFISFLWKISSSPFGRILKAIREDEIAVTSLGKNVTQFKRLAFILSACCAAVAGSLYASYVTYIDPKSFTMDESIFILTIVIFGGAGNIRGPIVGTLFLIILPEVLRFLRIQDSLSANMRQIIYGLLIVVIMRFRPQGLAGEYRFE